MGYKYLYSSLQNCLGICTGVAYIHTYMYTQTLVIGRIIGGDEEEWNSDKGHMAHESRYNCFHSFNSVMFFFFVVDN